FNKLQENLSISERGKQTGIISLSFSGEDRTKIQAILNDISQNYFLQNVQRNSAEAEQSLEFLKGHLPDIKTKLTASEDVLNRFRQENESIDLGLEAQSTLKVMVELEAQLNELTFKESEISQRFTQDHPAYKSLLDKRQTLLKEKERLNKQVQKLPKTQREVLRMTRDVEVNQQIYIQLLNKVQELNIIKA
ncbi:MULTISPECIES: GNVR domain-containing protein, partial [Vibrio]|uniref:GNVR domain-containing protein n=1 Tax=Vibrio TaxID=662 RepID=UPI00296498BD